MPTALTPKDRFDFSLECDSKLPLEKRTVFKLRALSLDERRIYDNELVRQDVMKDGTRRIMTAAGDNELALLRAGLVGWLHFIDETGHEVKFETIDAPVPVLGRDCAHVTDACLERLAPKWRTEIAKAIQEANQLSDDDVKN